MVRTEIGSRKTLIASIAVAAIVLPTASAGPGGTTRIRPGTTTRVSVATGGAEANGASLGAGLSYDGRFVAFRSVASNLVAGDTNRAPDVFVHDRQTRTTTRVNVATDGAEANFGGDYPSISSDGRYVAFYSNARNLVPGDTNFFSDVFVHDRLRSTTTRVSVATGGAQANGRSTGVTALSADGRLVAFTSEASNLVAGDTNGARDIFVHDRQTETTTRMSVASGGAQANGRSGAPALSPDGRYVGFVSNASNLVAGDTNSAFDVFVHDRASSTTTRVNVGPGGKEADFSSGLPPSLSAGGRFVAFESPATNLVPRDTNGRHDVFVRDRLRGTTTRVNVAADGAQAIGNSVCCGISSLSADGRFVVFDSNAPNLVVNDTNGDSDVFVRDRREGTTTRVSVAGGGAQTGGADSGGGAVVSGTGRVVAFWSEAQDMVAGDTNSENDVFVRDPITAPPRRCRVPKVIGLRLPTARMRIRGSNCRVGRVRFVQSGPAGRVLKQNPRPGATRARGTRVNLVVGSR